MPGEVREILDPHIINAIQAVGLALVAAAIVIVLDWVYRPRRPKWPPNPRDKD